MKALNAGYSTLLQERSDFKSTPSGQYKLCDTELKASETT